MSSSVPIIWSHRFKILYLHKAFICPKSTFSFRTTNLSQFLVSIASWNILTIEFCSVISNFITFSYFIDCLRLICCDILGSLCLITVLQFRPLIRTTIGSLVPLRNFWWLKTSSLAWKLWMKLRTVGPKSFLSIIRSKVIKAKL